MSKLIKSTLMAAAAALTLAASGAHAATASFDFYNNGGGVFDAKSSSLNFNANGIGLNITAVSTSSDAKVTYRWDGIGVYSGGLDAGELNSSLLHTPGDAILLTFSQAVSLSQIDFSLWEGNSFGALDKATITSNGQTYALSAALNDGGFLVDHFGVSGLIPASKYFLIQAQGDLSSFRLAGVTVTSAVPEANTVVMFGLGLLGVAALGRRSRKA